ncbi:hypothetical protein OAF47_00500 [bacterium]|nr:hypothetical protein [bacterium]
MFTDSSGNIPVVGGHRDKAKAGCGIVRKGCLLECRPRLFECNNGMSRSGLQVPPGNRNRNSTKRGLDGKSLQADPNTSGAWRKSGDEVVH